MYRVVLSQRSVCSCELLTRTVIVTIAMPGCKYNWKHSNCHNSNVYVLWSTMYGQYSICVCMRECVGLLSPHSDRHAGDISFTVSVFQCPQEFW